MNTIKWLLDGDVSVQYQTYRDLLNEERVDLKNRISTEGFGKRLLDLQNPDFHWGIAYYAPKWISTHYTLLELRRLNINSNENIMKVINIILDTSIANDGGISPNPKSWKYSDVCLNGMDLFVFCNFEVEESKIKSIIDYIITQQLPDGGFNCNFNNPRISTTHSSLHSTISLIEGINEFINKGYKYRVNELKNIRTESIEFILKHKLYKSDKTGEIIKKSFTMLSYPPRWKYDILRCLDALRESKIKYDHRMDDAFELLMKKRLKDGTWPVQAKHQGQVHFDMEKTGKSSRWNTLRALRVLSYFSPDIKY